MIGYSQSYTTTQLKAYPHQRDSRLDHVVKGCVRTTTTPKMPSGYLSSRLRSVALKRLLIAHVNVHVRYIIICTLFNGVFIGYTHIHVHVPHTVKY